MAKKDELTPKQAAFVREYLIDLNATQAAIRAGYSAKTAKDGAAQLLANISVKKAINVAMEARAANSELTAERVLNELCCLALYDPAEIAKHSVTSPKDICKLPENVRRAIIGWSWDKMGNFVLKLSPKTPNLDLLGRHLALFKDKLEVSGEVDFKDILGEFRK